MKILMKSYTSILMLALKKTGLFFLMEIFSMLPCSGQIKKVLLDIVWLIFFV